MTVGEYYVEMVNMKIHNTLGTVHYYSHSLLEYKVLSYEVPVTSDKLKSWNKFQNFHLIFHRKLDSELRLFSGDFSIVFSQHNLSFFRLPHKKKLLLIFCSPTSPTRSVTAKPFVQMKINFQICQQRAAIKTTFISFT